GAEAAVVQGLDDLAVHDLRVGPGDDLLASACAGDERLGGETVHFTGDLLERVDHHFAVGVLDVRDGLTALRRARVGGADVDGALRHGVPPEVWSGADRSAVDHAVGVVAFSWCTEVVGSEDPPDHDRDDRGAGELLGEPGDVPVQRGGDDDRLDLVVPGVAL